jgi:hypothetical protein
MAEESSAGFTDRIKEMLAQSEQRLTAMQDEIAELVEQYWQAQLKTVTDMWEQQQQSAKFAEHWEARQKAIADQIEERWKTQQKAITDMLEQRWNAQKKAIEDIGGMFRRKPE